MLPRNRRVRTPRFLLTPLREGRRESGRNSRRCEAISTHAPAGGATHPHQPGGGDHPYFYSRPCGRGDKMLLHSGTAERISTHAPAGGATRSGIKKSGSASYFYSRPCGRGDDLTKSGQSKCEKNFYSRPCGRGDSNFPQVRHEVLRQIAER